MTALEVRYRRLLAIYPSEHRAAYEQEMLGVLMDGARPGQRRPAPGEVVDLLLAGAGARLRHGRRGVRDARWRDAFAVTGLLAAAVLLAVAGRRLASGLHMIQAGYDPMRLYGVDGLLLGDVAARSAAWLAVLLALLAGLRRTAAGFAVAGAVVEVATLVAWLPVEQFRAFRMSWSPILAVLTVACLVLAVRARPVARVVGPRGLALLFTAMLLGAAASAGLLPWWMGAPGYLSGHAYPRVGPAVLLCAVLTAAGMRQVRPKVRRRVGVLLGVPLAVAAAQQGLWEGFDMTVASEVTAPMVVAQVTMLIAVPVAALGTGLTLLRMRERFGYRSFGYRREGQVERT